METGFESIIIINGSTSDDVKQALQAWIFLYAESLPKDFAVTLCNDVKNRIMEIKVGLDNESFYYLVNYLHYYKGIESIANVKGYTTGCNPVLGKKPVMVYIAQDEREKDTVYIVTRENKTYKIGFSGIRTIKEMSTGIYYKQPQEIQPINSEIIRAHKKNQEKSIRNKPEIIVKRNGLTWFCNLILYFICRPFLKLDHLTGSLMQKMPPLPFMKKTIIRQYGSMEAYKKVMRMAFRPKEYEDIAYSRLYGSYYMVFMFYMLHLLPYTNRFIDWLPIQSSDKDNWSWVIILLIVGTPTLLIPYYMSARHNKYLAYFEEFDKIKGTKRSIYKLITFILIVAPIALLFLQSKL